MVIFRRGIVLAAFALGAPALEAAPNTAINVHGIFLSSDIADPGQNSLSALIGKSFSFSFLVDSNPALVCNQPACNVANVHMDTAPNAGGWVENGLSSNISVSGVGSYNSNETVWSTRINQVLANDVTFAGTTYLAGTLLSEFGVNAWMPGMIALPGATSTLNDNGIVSGLNAELGFFGLNSMLGGVAPYPSALPQQGIVGAFASITEYANGVQVGHVQLEGTVSGSFADVQITPVPEPETDAMLLVGLGLLAGTTRRRFHRSAESAPLGAA